MLPAFSVHLVELEGTGQYFAMKAMDKGVMLNRNKVLSLIKNHYQVKHLCSQFTNHIKITIMICANQVIEAFTTWINRMLFILFAGA